jgi:uncharacterized protein (TIGR01244 family)
MPKDRSRSEPRTVDLSRTVTLGRAAPTEAEIDWLLGRGFRSVIDLRRDGEAASGLSPAAEAKALRRHGMEYFRAPTPTDRVDAALLDAFGAVLARAPKPVFVHCASGKRAGMFALAHTCIHAGIPGDDMLAMARPLDVLYGPEAFQRSFARYVDDRQARPDPMARRAGALHESGHPESVLATNRSPAAEPKVTRSDEAGAARITALTDPMPNRALTSSPTWIAGPAKHAPPRDWRFAAQVSAGSLVGVSLLLARRRLRPIMLPAAVLLAFLAWRGASRLRRQSLIRSVRTGAVEDAEIAALEARLGRLEASI